MFSINAPIFRKSPEFSEYFLKNFAEFRDVIQDRQIRLKYDVSTEMA